MMKELQGLGPWLVVAAVAVLAALVLLRSWRVRRRHRNAVQREMRRLQRELATREALESQD